MSTENIAGRTVDALGATAIIAAFVGYIPAIAALVAMVWYLVQLWESRTMQHWLQNRRMVRKAKKIARLRAREKVISAQLEALETIRQAKVHARDSVEIAKVEAAKIQASEETKAETNHGG